MIALHQVWSSNVDGREWYPGVIFIKKEDAEIAATDLGPMGGSDGQVRPIHVYDSIDEYLAAMNDGSRTDRMRARLARRRKRQR